MKKDSWILVGSIAAILVGYFTDPKSVTVFSEETTKAILMGLQIVGLLAGVFSGASVAKRMRQ